jgi:hypothetical protein
MQLVHLVQFHTCALLSNSVSSYAAFVAPWPFVFLAKSLSKGQLNGRWDHSFLCYNLWILTFNWQTQLKLS